MSLEDLMHAMLLASGNDAAQAISQSLLDIDKSGPEKRGIFINKMN